MSTRLFVASYLLNCLFWKWIISWGGAQKLQGWRSLLWLECYAPDWSAEQIRLYALCLWLASTFYFVLGLFKPEFRFQ